MRRAFATVAIQVGEKEQKAPPPLKVAVCSSYPCQCYAVRAVEYVRRLCTMSGCVLQYFRCMLSFSCISNSLQSNQLQRANVNTPVVLRACSNVPMLATKWERTSNAALLAADIAPLDQPVMTVTLRAAMPALARQSEPYTFTVKAIFEGDSESVGSASATLHINYVRPNCDMRVRGAVLSEF